MTWLCVGQNKFRGFSVRCRYGSLLERWRQAAAEVPSTGAARAPRTTGAGGSAAPDRESLESRVEKLEQEVAELKLTLMAMAK